LTVGVSGDGNKVLSTSVLEILSGNEELSRDLSGTSSRVAASVVIAVTTARATAGTTAADTAAEESKDDNNGTSESRQNVNRDSVLLNVAVLGDLERGDAVKVKSSRD